MELVRCLVLVLVVWTVPATVHSAAGSFLLFYSSAGALAQSTLPVLSQFLGSTSTGAISTPA